MKKPIIAITPSIQTDNQDLKLRPTYGRAVTAAGGIPVILPLEISPADLTQLFSRCDGVLFSGGGDIHPSYFDEDTHRHCGNLSFIRDQTEQHLLSLALGQRKPILGICRGLQIINIFLGGDIYQDIPSQLKNGRPADFPIAHQQPFEPSIPSHRVHIETGSQLEMISAGACELWVNSMHHQGVRRLAPKLSVCARSLDQLIEAAEMPGYPYLIGVQWHPEYLWPKDAAAKNLFHRFIASC